MNKKFFTLVAVIVAVIAVSCGKNADEASVPSSAGDSFYYSTFADAKVAADASGKAMVLDFYTDS